MGAMAMGWGQGSQAVKLEPAVAMGAHPLLQPADWHGSNRQQEREEREARRRVLRESRKPLYDLPVDHMFEIPGRPNVVLQIKNYMVPNAAEGRQRARSDIPFLFKAFETGQAPPPRPGTKKAEVPRAATIHEYLDWTVTASEAEDPDELDFGGFRVVVLLPRFRPQWPPPPPVDNPEVDYHHEAPLKHKGLVGAPKPPVPILAAHQKPICAATIRMGPSWMEVPFYATQESRRNKGHGRALLEAIEDICRALGIPRILLCSTDDARTKATWQRLGFSFVTQEQLQRLGVTHHDLLHMDNTVQMYKEVSQPVPWKTLMLRHGDLKQRMYYLPPSHAVPLPPPLVSNGVAAAARGVAKKPSKPAKKRPRKR
ncbi:RING FYVE PHD zinc finger [Chlorella sorokiniana]|uniref:RING FYVE PHD zinc finger n=1 Tax=Chlorella sorokiniana TaxID=3076 RepID=A0A2P6TG67_CHLSO|nr:RING FYVE PHD zinc finger [Chlorella sorokiniana]|eukprot:PRW33111.1 RING FYVE PHD zinc finger [Chlorella sorokiniana]